MQVVSPNELDTVRAYFTGFDLHQILQHGGGESPALKRQITLLCLLKGHIVIAASHLVESMSVSPVVVEYMPLLKNGIIVPALRSEFHSVADFINYQDPKRITSWVGMTPVEEAAKLLDANARYAVSWNVEGTSALFSRLLIDHVRNADSLLRSLLPDVSQVIADAIVDKLEHSKRLSRDDIQNSLRHVPSERSRMLFKQYADLAYYVSGAKAVEFVGILPQENLGTLDYGKPLSQKRLCEGEIFFRYCANAVFAASGARVLPEDLDKIEVEDILAIRARWIGPTFRKKYNRIQELCRSRVNVLDPHGLILRLEELDTLANELAASYRGAARREALIRKAGKSGMSLLSLTLSGVFDGIDYALTGLQALGDWIDDDRSGESPLVKIEKHLAAARRRVEDVLGAKQELFSMIDALNDIVRRRLD